MNCHLFSLSLLLSWTSDYSQVWEGTVLKGIVFDLSVSDSIMPFECPNHIIHSWSWVALARAAVCHYLSSLIKLQREGRQNKPQNCLEEHTKEIPAIKWLRLEFDWEFRGLVLLLLKSVQWDHKLPSRGLEASVSGNGSMSVLSPDFDSALSQKGRVLLAVPLLSHLYWADLVTLLQDVIFLVVITESWCWHALG